MNLILLYVSSGLIIFSFLSYFILVLFYRRTSITKSDGFNVTKDILAEYNSINIIENKSYFTVYNIKRRVIKIASKCYYGNSLSDVVIPLIEASISAIDDNKNRYIDIFRNVFNNLKYLYFFSLIALVINGLTYNINDAKVGIVLIVIFSILSYILINIKTEAMIWINDNLNKIKDINKDNQLKVINFINKILLFDKVIFIGELIMIIRFVAILLDFN